MSKTDTEAQNRKLADGLIEEVRKNPQSPYAGKFVGIAHGKVVVVADTLSDMDRRLREAEPDPRKCTWVEPSRDHSRAVEIWRLT